jgi:hydrogenase maturation protease
LKGQAGEVVGVLIREQQSVEGTLDITANEIEDGLYRLTLRISNMTHQDNARTAGRDEALLRSLVSTHAILGVDGGAFVSLMDPPDRWREAASSCRNLGAWPVLVGEEGSATMMLSSPIILYDYPQVAAESPGDLFDGAEIDEILSLRILTLTDEEKHAAAEIDERAGAMLARTEALAREQLMGLHGTVRGLREVNTGGRT